MGGNGRVSGREVASVDADDAPGDGRHSWWLLIIVDGARCCVFYRNIPQCLEGLESNNGPENVLGNIDSMWSDYFM
ncbi:hypothetical protein Dimus_020608 [Dionaea muscipula]